MSLELLLARADDHQPLLPRGLTLEKFPDLPFPKLRELPESLWDAGGDSDFLPKQRWGVVAPLGPEGDRLLVHISPLVRWRERQQGASVHSYRAPVGMDAATAARWKRREFRKEAVDESDRPRYLLLLGDMDGLSLDLQQVLSTDAFVGRLAFPTGEGYEAYCAKVLKWEASDAQRPVRPRVLLYTARDGTRATGIAHDVLMGPSFEALRDRQPKDFPDAELLEIIDEKGASTVQWLNCVAEPVPRVMLSLSHGLGSGWKSPEQQRELQGAFVLPDKSLLTGADLVSRPFLPGGIWFYLACYGAGTPGRSSYEPWLQQLRDVDMDAARILAEGLPRAGTQPFTAALPQAVLTNPSGPLAVIGHVDLAWTSTFSDEGNLAHSRFLGVLRTLIQGRRVGNALHTLLRFFSESLVELTALFKQDERERAAGRDSSVDPKVKAGLWLLCQDLANYVLLGDPAVRLPGLAVR
ncbi:MULTISPECIES: hypothetical protein [unclassified Myxococcus]|uniref:hypothetical protein n=1 Tax=unclassified Myxococcus TaxID=2648731 RepID=UPI00157A2856|nr:MULTISPECIES: hypothetical protein [unclassified Myxococcus]NTX33992.1 hypothetical protein [Myxococcus sp. CA033]NTX54909.1 hypothetical protein [Myxococcus sp. CA039A]